jgi:trimeric autotransporter adhesin
MVVVVIVVVAAGVGSYVGLNQTQSASTSISTTVTPETSSTSSSAISTPSSSTPSTTASTLTSTSTSTPTTSTSQVSSTTNLTSVTTQEETMLNSTTTLLSTLISETSSTCSSSIAYNNSLTNLLTSGFPPSLTKDLMGNFSQMSVFLNTSSSSNSSGLGNLSSLANEVVSGSYNTIGLRVINGTTFTLVGLRIDLSLASISENESGTIYFNSAWNASVINLGGYNATGAFASQIGGELMIFFELPFLYNSLQLELLQYSQTLNQINQTSATFGNVTMNVTNYNATSSMNSTTTVGAGCFGSTAVQVSASRNGVVQMGTIPGTNTTILTAIISHSSGITQGILVSSNELFQIKSLTLASPSTTTSSSSSSSTTTATSTSSLTSI